MIPDQKTSAPRFALIVGHEKVAPGAYGVSPLNQSEYEYNGVLALLISKHCQDLMPELEIQTFYRDHGGVKEAYTAVNSFSPLGCIELHFNACNRVAFGSEVLIDYEAHKGATLLSVYILDAIYASFNRKGLGCRGIKVLHPHERGENNLHLAKGYPALISEPFFGDNIDDAILAFDHQDNLALQLAKGILLFVRNQT